MIFTKQGSCLYFLILIISISIFSSCSKEEPFLEVKGDYCSYRIGPTGHTTSSVTIKIDSTEQYDLIISNISGYENSSQAFKTIGINRINNQLIIPDHTVLIGSSGSMVITGEGSIEDSGTIVFQINTITESNEDTFTLYLNNNASFNYYTSYTGPGQSLSLQANKILLSVTTEENEVLNFTIIESENENCSLSIPRQSAIEQNSNQTYLLEVDLFFGGKNAYGTLLYSASGWQNAKSIELSLD